LFSRYHLRCLDRPPFEVCYIIECSRLSLFCFYLSYFYIQIYLFLLFYGDLKNHVTSYFCFSLSSAFFILSLSLFLVFLYTTLLDKHFPVLSHAEQKQTTTTTPSRNKRPLPLCTTSPWASLSGSHRKGVPDKYFVRLGYFPVSHPFTYICSFLSK
jgi:hypothetical protein